jgi:hypothetical protein
MQLIKLVFIALLFSSQAKAQEEAPSSDIVTEKDLDAAKEFGFSNSAKIKSLNKKLKQSTNASEIQNQVITDLETFGKRGELVDKAVSALIKSAVSALRYKGFDKEADEIEGEYALYLNAFSCMDSGCILSGDHPPMNEWLDGVHDKIHDKLGDFWCKYFHFHDLEILNMGVPVVFNPKDYGLKHYKEHFAGEINFGMFWNFHGVAGVVTYWAVQITCSAGTSGIGLATFACGPIAGFAEHVMDKRIAPPVATRIWNRAHKN